ncbi:MAG: hypothetical protein ACTSQE_13450 [Candidatus Heimdallarchaeaceae archaeon]
MSQEERLVEIDEDGNIVRSELEDLEPTTRYPKGETKTVTDPKPEA